MNFILIILIRILLFVGEPRRLKLNASLDSRVYYIINYLVKNNRNWSFN